MDGEILWNNPARAGSERPDERKGAFHEVQMEGYQYFQNPRGRGVPGRDHHESRQTRGSFAVGEPEIPGYPWTNEWMQTFLSLEGFHAAGELASAAQRGEVSGFHVSVDDSQICRMVVGRLMHFLSITTEEAKKEEKASTFQVRVQKGRKTTIKRGS